MITPESLFSDQLATRSSFFENLHTHRFLADVLTCCVRRSPTLFLDVLRSEVDDAGADLILSAGAVIRQIQLKARAGAPAPKPYAISRRLVETPGGCVIWIRYDKADLSVLDYYALMGLPDQSIDGFGSFGDATKRNGAQRPGHIEVPMKKANHKGLSVKALCTLLFPNPNS